MIGVVHLVWGPLGVDPLRRFVRSYRAHDPGLEHQLIVVLNGVANAAHEAALLHELDGTPHQLLRLDRPTLDLAAYGIAARATSHEVLCFLNSYSVILADRWLAHIAHGLAVPRAEIVGATGSWESQAEWQRGHPLAWPYQILRCPRMRRDYPRFPNPHIRTTAFAMRRDTVIERALDKASDKRDTYLLESGRQSITAQALCDGRRALVAGRDGHLYDVEDWPNSATFRRGHQANLLVADNRTEEWSAAASRTKQRLTRDAWGPCR